MPSLEIVLMLVLIAATLVAFAREVLPIEVTALALLGVLLVLDVVSLEQALSGLSNKAVVTIGAMLVLSQALVNTGFVESASERLERLAGRNRTLGVTILLAAAALASGVLNNTAIVAIFIPLALDLCKRLRLSPSRVMMPLSFAAIFGGTLTLVGTSTNLIVAAVAEDHGLEKFGMLEFAPLGAVLMVIGVAYLVLAGPRLLPIRSTPDRPTRAYGMRPYLAELRVLPGAELIGETAETAQIGPLYDVTVISIVRSNRTLTRNVGVIPFEPGDVLIVRGSAANLLRMKREAGVATVADTRLGERQLAERGLVVVEAVIPPASRLIGRTLTETDFRHAYGAFVLAIRRRARTLRDRLANVPLRFADGLLMIGPVARMRALRGHGDLIVTSRLPRIPVAGARRWVVLVVLPLVVLAAAAGTVDIVEAAVIGVVVLFVSRAMRPREAYRSIEWSVLILIAAFVPVGTAMETSGTAAYIAGLITRLVAVLPDGAAPWLLLGAVYLATSLMTEAVSNNATAILMAPIAIQLAAGVGASPRPFLFAVCFAASAAFMTPHGYQTNMMVYGPGNYRFMDYVRFGAPLDVLAFLVAWTLIPVIWPF